MFYKLAETHHRGQNLLHDGANDVGEVTGEPYYDKLDTEAFCAAAPEVLDDLRREDHDPTCCFCISQEEIRSMAIIWKLTD